MASSLMVGESLVGDGNEVAHIDLLIGSKDGPVGEAFAAALINQKEGHTNLLAVVAPNLPAKPDTIMANKVTLKGAAPGRADVRAGAGRRSRARSSTPCARAIIPQDQVEDLCIIVGVFIHWEAADDKKIFDWNYEATKESIARALGAEPSAAAGRRRGGRGAAPVRRGSRGVGRSAGPRVAAGRAPARRRPRGRHGREQRHRRRDRRGVRRRRRDACSSRTAAARRPRARSPTASRPAAAARSSRAPTSARARAARRSSPRRASGWAASTCGSTTPAPTCSPGTRPTGTGSASSTSCSPSTSRAPSRARTRPARSCASRPAAARS